MSPLVKNILMLMALVVICLLAGAVGSLAVGASRDDWYRALRKPSWNPPDWLFAPVWTALYLLMAMSAWLVWRRGGDGHASLAMLLFALQLVLNASWSPVFFGLRSIGGAMAIIAVLWLAILATVMAFWHVTAASGILMLSYLGWVSFAAALNFAIRRLNR